MDEGPKDQDVLETMAFQILLHKVTGLEQAVQALPPLLKKIIDYLEAQSKPPEVPVASYAQLYPALEKAETSAPMAAVAQAVPVSRARRRRMWQWFVKEAP
jgi:hypothetical protein